AAAAAVRVGHPFPFEPEDFAALRTAMHVERVLAVERRHGDRRPQRRLGVTDRRLAVKIEPVALEERIVFNFDGHKEIAGGGPWLSFIPLAADADAHATVESRGKVDFNV